MFMLVLLLRNRSCEGAPQKGSGIGHINNHLFIRPQFGTGWTKVPYCISTVGSWKVRVWQTSAGASGEATAPLQVVVPLKSGEKKTILLLDKLGGGVRIELL